MKRKDYVGKKKIYIVNDIFKNRSDLVLMGDDQLQLSDIVNIC